jgi:isoleucyl-tRNA synthetase
MSDLPMLFIVSEVALRNGTADGPARFAAERATGVKCERCWRYVPAVSAEPGREGLCERCLDALAEPVRS